jgi:hypothetical protein
MADIIGKWVQAEGQPYHGLWFAFKDDGTFTAEYESMGIVSGGTYAVDGENITLQQTEHTFGFVGEFKGLIAIEENQLKMALVASPGEDRPVDLSGARIYIKEQ